MFHIILKPLWLAWGWIQHTNTKQKIVPRSKSSSHNNTALGITIALCAIKADFEKVGQEMRSVHDFMDEFSTDSSQTHWRHLVKFIENFRRIRKLNSWHRRPACTLLLGHRLLLLLRSCNFIFLTFRIQGVTCYIHASSHQINLAFSSLWSISFKLVMHWKLFTLCTWTTNRVEFWIAEREIERQEEKIEAVRRWYYWCP